MNSNPSGAEEGEFISASLPADSSPEIIVIGDDDIAAIIQSYVSDAGYDVTTVHDVSGYVSAGSGDAASELIILTITRSMLEDGELQLDEQFERSDLPVLAISGPTITEAQAEHTDANIVNWLTKPFQRSDLVQHVEESIELTGERSETNPPADSDAPESTTAAQPVAEPSDGAVSLNGDDPDPTTDEAVTADPTSSTQDALSDTGSTIEPDPHSMPARADELETVRTRIQELEAKHEAVSEDIAALTQQCSELSEGMTTVSDQLEALNNRIDRMDERTGEIESDVDENQQMIEPLSEGMDTLADEQLRVIDRVEQATHEQAELRAALDALTDWQNDVSEAFSALQAEE